MRVNPICSVNDSLYQMRMKQNRDFKKNKSSKFDEIFNAAKEQQNDNTKNR